MKNYTIHMNFLYKSRRQFMHLPVQYKYKYVQYKSSSNICHVWYAERYCQTDDNRPKLTPRVPRLSHELMFILIAYFYQRLKKKISSLLDSLSWILSFKENPLLVFCSLHTLPNLHSKNYTWKLKYSFQNYEIDVLVFFQGNLLL